MKSKFTWIFTLLLAFFIQFAFAQEKTITGVVTDGAGMPIPGANVVIQGSTQGVQTDFDGRYSIAASVGQKLVFSFVGMATQTVTVGASNTVSVQLADDARILDDVVVEAYRTTTRATSNIAVTTITSKTIEGRPNANFIQTLQGQVPGLNIATGSGQPGSNSTVILRGYGSLNGNVEPLYVIDGVPLNSDNFRSINPNDIESLSVLKDAGATSIYGNRGANGVIIVKTKRGSYDSPLNIKYTATTSLTSMQNNEYRLMNAKQLLTLERNVGRGFGSYGGANGAMTDEEINAYGINTNWQDVFFRTGTGSNHVLSLTSGSKNLSSFTSFGYYDIDGIVEGTDLKRFNFRNNLSGKSDNNKFNYSTSLTINYSRSHTAASVGTGSVNYNPLSGANNGAPYIDPRWYNGNGTDLANWYDQGIAPEGVNYNGQGTLGLTPLILLNRLQTGMLQTDELKMIANVQGSYKILDDLTLGTSIGSDYTENVGLSYENTNNWTRILFDRISAGQEFVGGQTDSFAREFAFNANTSLNYNKNFGKHTIDASLFTEYYKAHLKSFSAAQDGLDPKTWDPGNGGGYVPFDPASPNFYLPVISSGKAEAGLFSYFGSFDYDYDQRFGLSATVRRDASYRFSDTNKWGTFWSVSGRWNIDKESFMQGSAFNMLKLRASYGTTGNQNILGQSIFNAGNASRTLFASANGYGNQLAYVLDQIGNPDLKWETVEQANIGVDFEAWNSRLRGNVDVYRRTTKDLYQTLPISGVNGTYGILANSGSLRNSGVEALVSYDVVRNQDFTFTLLFNGSYNKNEFVEIPTLEGLIDNGLQANVVGGALGQYYLIPYAGVNPTNGNLLFYNSQGQLTENPNPETDRRLTGKAPVPKYQGGFGFEANYKGFYATTQFSYVQDIYRFDYDLESLQDPFDIGVFNKSTDLLNAWTPDNRNTDIPALGFTNKGQDASSDRYLKDASYVRLRYATVGYDFPKDMLQQTPFSSIRAFVQGENLVTWTKWRGWDAESPRGSDVYQYPTSKIISVGLELQF